MTDDTQNLWPDYAQARAQQHRPVPVTRVAVRRTNPAAAVGLVLGLLAVCVAMVLALR